jgi:hypothetical protein
MLDGLSCSEDGVTVMLGIVGLTPPDAHNPSVHKLFRTIQDGALENREHDLEQGGQVTGPRFLVGVASEWLILESGVLNHIRSDGGSLGFQE